MAGLEEGFQYGLSSSSISSSNKTVVQVKLTDTALRIIEEYLKRKNSISQTPCIQFKGNQGTIQIPDRGDSGNTFKFSLSGLQGEPNGSFDAVCQPNIRAGSGLSLEGCMSHKVQIHATSELFQTTKDRVTQAEQDHKKYSTKVIDQTTSRNIGSKKTTVLRNSHPSLSQRTPHAGHTSSAPKPKPPSSMTSSTHSAFTKRPSPSYSNNSASSQSQSNAGSQGQSHGGSQGHSSAVASPYSNASVPVTSSKPTSPSLNTSSSSTVARSSGNPAVMSMPYRDRIIHLLAIRPYKKPELIIRLRKDGVREKDKDSLGTLLSQVAISKDNSYTLAKHLYVEVRDDWPFYTDDDRQKLRKKRQSLSSVSPSASPANRSPDSQTAPLSQQPSKKPESHKRSIDDSGQPTTHHNAKKKRISLYEKPTGKCDARPGSEERHSNHGYHSNNVSSTTDISDKKENIDDTVDSTSDTPEYMRQYFTISNSDQRSKYKLDFNTEYEEYRELHTKIDKVQQKFLQLQVLRKQTPRDTVEFEKINERIRSEYLSQKSDAKFSEQKHRFEYLHEKLAYIKKLIVDYDQKYLPVSS